MRAWPLVLTPLLYVLAACSGGADKSDDTPQPRDAPMTDTAVDEPPVETPSDYPAGPYGMKVGQTFPDFELQGYHDGVAPWTTLRLKDLYDRTGDKGITAIYLSIGAVWCPGCQGEANSLPAKYPEYRKKGARFFSILVQTGDHTAADQSTIDAWIDRYSINYDIAADGEMSVLGRASPGGGSIALPYDMAIDPRTMKVTYVKSGPIFLGSAGFPGVDELIAKNGKH
jgi:peroxiredoxin